MRTVAGAAVAVGMAVSVGTTVGHAPEHGVGVCVGVRVTVGVSVIVAVGLGVGVLVGVSVGHVPGQGVGVRSAPTSIWAVSLWPTGSSLAEASSTCASGIETVVVPCTAGTNVKVPTMPLPCGPNGAGPSGGVAPSVTQFCRTRVVAAVLPGNADDAMQTAMRPELPRKGPWVKTGGVGKMMFEYSMVTEKAPKLATSSTRISTSSGEPTLPLISDGTGQMAIASCGPQAPGGAMPVGVAVGGTVCVGVGVIVGVSVSVEVGSGVPLLDSTWTEPFEKVNAEKASPLSSE